MEPCQRCTNAHRTVNKLKFDLYSFSIGNLAERLMNESHSAIEHFIICFNASAHSPFSYIC